MRVLLRVGPSRAGRRLADVAAEWLPQALGQPLSRAATRKLIAAGAVRVDGRRGRPGETLRTGSRLEAVVRLDALPAAHEAPAIDAGRLLYEDGALVAVDKPPGLPMHATADPARPHLEGLLRAFLARRDGCDPVDVRLSIHQRLDRDTSGVVLFGRDARADRALAAAFSGRSVEKTYRALVARPPALPPRTWEVGLPLSVSSGGRVRVDPDRGLDARTTFARVEVGPHMLLVEARPHTGRKHQVRVHLAASGLPILGDRTYAPREVAAAAPRTMLHAARLALAHPLTGAALTLHAPDPPDFAALLAGRRE